MPPSANQTPDRAAAAGSTARASWHVLGAGAMGCLWAARIWQQGSRGEGPCLLLRDAATLAEYTRAAGILLEQDGQLTHCPLRAHVIDRVETPISHLLISTKAQDAATALASVTPYLAPDAQIVLLQNGLRQLALVQAHSDRSIYCLSTSHGAWLASRFHVVQAGFGEAWLGRPGRNDECTQLLAQLPADAMRIRCDDNIAARVWFKFAVNCAINALTVVHQCRNGELLTLSAARQQLRGICAEIEQILAAIPDAPVFDLFPAVEAVCQATASNFSSTLQDVRKGRATEISELNGYLCELAEQHDAVCSLNRELYQAVLASAGARLSG